MPTKVDAPLPQLDLLPGTTLTVTLDDPGAVIASLVLHGWQTIPDLPDDAPDPFPVYVSVAHEGE